jgi:hypothetical protein
MLTEVILRTSWVPRMLLHSRPWMLLHCVNLKKPSWYRFKSSRTLCCALGTEFPVFQRVAVPSSSEPCRTIYPRQGITLQRNSVFSNTTLRMSNPQTLNTSQVAHLLFTMRSITMFSAHLLLQRYLVLHVTANTVLLYYCQVLSTDFIYVKYCTTVSGPS